MKKTLIILLISFLGIQFTNAQETKSFSLKEAMDYAVANSYRTQTSKLDFQSTVAQRKGFISIGLPQVNTSFSYQYYASIPTQLMPDFLSPAVSGILAQYGLISPSQIPPMGDDKLPVQFGSKNSASGGLSVNQLVFDGTFIMGLKAARQLVDLSALSNTKTINETKAGVAQAYYLVLTTQENIRILDSTYINMNQILQQNKAIQANGFMEETDIEQFTLNVSNLKNKVDYAKQTLLLLTDMLKFQMGVDINQNIVLTDNINSILNEAIGSALYDKDANINSNPDYLLIKANEQLQMSSLRVDKSKYYPTMNLFLSSQYTAQRDKFDFFKKEVDWYNTTVIGVNLSVPIWSSGIRHYKIVQGKLNVQKQQILAKQVEEGVKLDIQNSKNALKMYTEQFYTDKKNLALSGKIYNKTNIKFKEGVSSSMDLNQAYLQMLTQEGNYINTIMQLLTNYNNLKKATNSL